MIIKSHEGFRLGRSEKTMKQNPEASRRDNFNFRSFNTMKSRQNKVVISFDQTELSGEFLLFRERLDEHNKSDQP